MGLIIDFEINSGTKLPVRKFEALNKDLCKCRELRTLISHVLKQTTFFHKAYKILLDPCMGHESCTWKNRTITRSTIILTEGRCQKSLVVRWPKLRNRSPRSRLT